MQTTFLPVILGTDSNAYGMAKAFHMAYGIKALVVGQGELFTTSGSTILNVRIIPELSDPTTFSEKLMRLAQELSPVYEKLILIASSDGYVELIVNNKAELQKAYVVPFIDAPLMMTLNSKASFYETCERFGLDYPDTRIIRKNELADVPQLMQNWTFGYPVVLKPSDSMRYFEAKFEGKEKAYILFNQEVVIETINKIYASSYDGELILQAYVAGDDSHMRVLNCVSGPDGKVRLMVLGQPLLEDPTPTLVGNYTAIIDAYDDSVFIQYKNFLEGIGYVGYSNFDMKYDAKSNAFKVFEINLRQGRSSFFVTGSGFNQAQYLVDAFIFGSKPKLEIGHKPHLWLGIPPRVLLQYLESPDLKARAQALMREGKVSFTLKYNKDYGIMRRIRVMRYYNRYLDTFQKYFKKKN